MARGLCGRKCFRHLSGYEMATLAAYDPGHGLHPWSRIKEWPSHRHGPAVTLPESGASLSEKLRVATLHGRLPTSPGSLAHNRLSHTRPVRYETFPLYFRILRKTSNAAQAALRHSHPFLTLAKRIGLEPKHIP